VFCPQILSGCFDSRELDTVGIVMGTAIDKADAPDRYKVTVQIASPSKGGSEKKEEQTEKGGGGAGGEFLNVSQSGQNINYIIREMQNKMSRMIYMAHSQNIVFGEELAGRAQGLPGFLRAGAGSADVADDVSGKGESHGYSRREAGI
jgi:spore germination protein KC